MKNNNLIKLEDCINNHDFNNGYIYLLPKGFIKLKDDNIYFFKRCVKDLAYRELIAHEIADFLKIPSLKYHLIKIPNKEGNYDLGVISLNYQEAGYKYIKGIDILKDFYKDYNHEWNEYINNSTIFNNLENIWYALEHRYQFSSNKKEIVAKLMHQLINNIFLFDIFLADSDRHFINWEIKEKDEDVNINILFDCEDILLKTEYGPRLTVNYENRKTDWYCNLEYFLKNSSLEFQNLVLNYYNSLTPMKFTYLMMQAEINNKCQIPLTTKEEMTKKYQKHYLKIHDIIKKVIKDGNEVCIYKLNK